MRITSSIVILLSFALIPFVAIAEPEMKGSPTELANYLSDVPKTITITGQSKLAVQSDSALVILNVMTEKETLQKTLQENQNIRNGIVAALMKTGINKNSIVASKFSTTPQYGIISKKPTSYKMENIVKITVKNEKEFMEVAKLIDTNDKIIYSGIEFKHSNKDELKRNAVAQACADAIKKKELYEKNLGIKLATKSFSEETVTEEVPFRNVVSKRSKLASYSDVSWGSGGSKTFGELIFYGQISVGYVINR